MAKNSARFLGFDRVDCGCRFVFGGVEIASTQRKQVGSVVRTHTSLRVVLVCVEVEFCTQAWGIARANSVESNESECPKSFVASGFGRSNTGDDCEFCTENFSFLHECRNGSGPAATVRSVQVA